MNPDEMLSESLKAGKKYRDVAAAALEAFQSAAYAAAAARAAVELSRSESQDTDQDYQGTKYELEDTKNSNNALMFQKIHPTDNTSSESEGEYHPKELGSGKNKPGVIDRTPSTSSSDSDRNIPSLKHQDLDSDTMASFPTDDIQNIGQYNADREEYSSDEDGNKSTYRSTKCVLLKSQSDSTVNSTEGKSKLKGTHREILAERLNSQLSGLDRRHLSMRTRREYRGAEKQRQL